MKNIAILTQSLCGGGAERMAANMSMMFSKKYNVFLFVFDSEKIDYEYSGTIVDVTKNYKNKSPLSILKTIFRIKRLKKHYKIDCTISFQDRPNLFNVFSRTRDKVICSLHTSPIQVFKKDRTRRFLQKMCSSFSDKYICVSKKAYSDLINIFHFSKKKVICIYNCVNIESIKNDSKKQIDNGISAFLNKHFYNIVYSARFIKSKGHMELIKAFSIIKSKNISCGLILLGSGDEIEHIKKLSSDLKLNENVFFAGNIKNPFAVISRCDLFVMPSYYEGLPMVLIESLACGCPILSCDIISGPREIILPDSDINEKCNNLLFGDWGCLVPEIKTENEDRTCSIITSNEQMFAKGILEVLCDSNRKNSMKRNTLNGAQYFSEDKILDCWESLLRELF